MTRIIDIHTHVFPDALAPGAISRLEAAGPVNASYDGTVSGLVSAMDRAGVSLSVTQAVATKPSQVRSINEWAATTTSDRILPFGAIHPDVDDPAAEVALAASLGIRGLKMHPEYQQFEPHEPRMRPVLDAALEHGMMILMHAGADVSVETVRGTPASFSKMLDSYPGLTVILAHMGGWQRWDAVQADLIGRHDFYIDTSYTLGHLPDERFVELVRAHGSDRVLFGSDGPWTDVAAEIEHLSRTGLTEAELEAVLGGNAERLLGL